MATLILAVRFLTIVPVTGREADGPGALGRAAWWFPVIGLGLGVVLIGVDAMLAMFFPPLLTAVLVLTLWKVVTGGIHLDGLADCLDGLGGRDQADRLAIMKDESIGVFGAVGLILCLLIGLSTLSAIPVPLRWRVLLLAPVVGRLAPLIVGPRFHPATPDHGSGAPFLRAVSPWAGPVHLIAVAALAGWLLGPWGILIVVGGLVAVWIATAFLAWRFGGLTGDVLGAGVELGELTLLLAGASLAHLGIT